MKGNRESLLASAAVEEGAARAIDETSVQASTAAMEILTEGRMELLGSVVEAFEEFEERAYGDTVRHRVLQLLLEHRGSLSLVEIARSLGLDRSSTKAYRFPRGYGAVREAVERLASQGIVQMEFSSGRYRCRVARGSLVVQWILFLHSMKGRRSRSPEKSRRF